MSASRDRSRDGKFSGRRHGYDDKRRCCARYTRNVWQLHGLQAGTGIGAWFSEGLISRNSK